MTETAFPLCWPIGQARTKIRSRARFSTRPQQGGRARELTVQEAIVRLETQLELLGANQIVLSSNLELRMDGRPRSNQGEPVDRGIALYFTFRKQRTAMGSDRWDRTADNIAALAAHIDCMRGIERYGVGTLEQAFRGYAKLEDYSSGIPWRRVFGIKDDQRVTLAEIENLYRRRAKECHPDLHSQTDGLQMMQITAAIVEARKELAGA